VWPGEEEEESEEGGGCSLPAAWVILGVVTCGELLLAQPVCLCGNGEGVRNQLPLPGILPAQDTCRGAGKHDPAAGL